MSFLNYYEYDLLRLTFIYVQIELEIIIFTSLRQTEIFGNELLPTTLNKDPSRLT